MRLLLTILLCTFSLFAAETVEEAPEKKEKQRRYSRFDYQLGAGYSLMRVEDQATFPAGFALYGGVGFRMNRLIAVGAEYEFDQGWTLRELDGKLQAHLPKAYLKFKLADIFALTGLVGAGLYRFESPDRKHEYNSFLLGARATLFFLYAQIDMAMADVVVPKLAVGFSLSM